jgi:hypothetical protein
MISPPLSRETSASSSSVRLGALSLALAGILFFLYPALRPFSDQAGAQTMLGAQAFASPFWVVAHMLGVVGFILLALSLLGLYGAPPFPNAKEESLVPSRRWVKSPFSRVGIPLCAEEKSSHPFQEGRRQMQVQICVQGHLNLSWDGRLSIRLMGRPGLLDRCQIRLRCTGYAYQMLGLVLLLSLETSAAKGGESRRTLVKRGSPTKRRTPPYFTDSSTIRPSSTMCFSKFVIMVYPCSPLSRIIRKQKGMKGGR